MTAKCMKRQISGTDTIEFHILLQTPNGKGTHIHEAARKKNSKRGQPRGQLFPKQLDVMSENPHHFQYLIGKLRECVTDMESRQKIYVKMQRLINSDVNMQKSYSR